MSPEAMRDLLRQVQTDDRGADVLMVALLEVEERQQYARTVERED